MWNGKNKALPFSFDDAVTQDIRLIELLEKYNLKCTFNLNSGFLGQKGILDRWGRRISHYKIHPEDVKYVYDGHEVAVHTVNHPVLPDCSDEVVIREVEQDRISLSELVGYEVVGMAYPSRGIGDDVKSGGENFRKKDQKHTVTANRQRKELRELELPKPAEGAEFPESHGGTTERLVLRA